MVVLKGLVFLLLVAFAWVLYEGGQVFFAMIAVVVGFLSLVAESERPAVKVGGIGGEVKKEEARDRPPFTYQLAAAGKAFGAVMNALWNLAHWFIYRGEKKK